MIRSLAPFFTGLALLCLTAIPWTPPARPGRDIGRGTRIQSSTRSDPRGGPRRDGLDAATSHHDAADWHALSVLLAPSAAPAATLDAVYAASASPSKPHAPAGLTPASRAPPAPAGR